MGMKKTDVADVTIRAVGDVTKIGPSDTAKAGADAPDTGIAAPNTSGNPSGAINSQAQYDTPYNPSLDGLPAPDDTGAGKGSGIAQPDMGTAKDAGDSAQTTPSGQKINFPAAADKSSAGGIKNDQGTGGSLVMKTGSAVKYPAASDTTSAGGVKMTESWANK